MPTSSVAQADADAVRLNLSKSDLEDASYDEAPVVPSSTYAEAPVMGSSTYAASTDIVERVKAIDGVDRVEDLLQRR